MSVTGDFGALAGLRARLMRLAEEQAQARLAQVLGAAAIKLLADEFRSSVDPYGDPWRALAWRNGQPLRKTNRMQSSSYIARAGADGFVLRIGTNYAVMHQKGARVRQPAAGRKSRGKVGRILRRRMVPDKRSGIGPIWGEYMKAEAASFVRRELGNGPA